MRGGRRALVVGGGVSGLTTALALQRAGWQLQVSAEQWAPEIVSGVAGAIWFPYQVAHPQAAEWALDSAQRFEALAASRPDLVRIIDAVEYQRRPTPPLPESERMAGSRALARGELPPGYVAGYRYRVPVIETPRYMAWLREEVGRSARLVTETVSDLAALLDEWPLVVNATGLAARGLVGDETLLPIQGQIVLLEPGLTEQALFDDGDPEQPIYIIPRRDATVVGGTARRGEWSTTPDEALEERLVSRAAALLPVVRDARRLGRRVGLRPGRATVRLEAERHGSGLLIHNYGHGGAGFTVSWGCAGAVVALAASGAEERA